MKSRPPCELDVQELREGMRNLSALPTSTVSWEGIDVLTSDIWSPQQTIDFPSLCSKIVVVLTSLQVNVEFSDVVQ